VFEHLFVAKMVVDREAAKEIKKFAAVFSRAAPAFKLVVGGEQFQIRRNRIVNIFGIGCYIHAFGDERFARRLQAFLTFDFNDADATIRFFVDAFQKAQTRNRDADGVGGFQNRVFGGDAHGFSVDAQIY